MLLSLGQMDLVKAHYWDLLQVFFMQKKYIDSVNILNSRTPLLTESPQYYALLARAYMQLGEPQSAAEIFKQIVTIEPNNVIWWLGLALSTQQMGDISSAITSYKQAQRLSTSNPQVALFIGKQLNVLQS